MPPFTALLHAHNDALRLGRVLETLYPCDEILVVDHGSTDATLHVAREYGARVVAAKNGLHAADYCPVARWDWILCLDPREAVTEALAASLFEWKLQKQDQVRLPPSAFSVLLREETAEGWRDLTPPQTRLIPRAWKRWQGNLPVHDPAALTLEGSLLRFSYP